VDADSLAWVDSCAGADAWEEASFAGADSLAGVDSCAGVDSDEVDSAAVVVDSDVACGAWAGGCSVEDDPVEEWPEEL
jgi:hypothetical protein